jgi:hypothetical protein
MRHSATTPNGGALAVDSHQFWTFPLSQLSIIAHRHSTIETFFIRKAEVNPRSTSPLPAATWGARGSRRCGGRSSVRRRRAGLLRS